MAKKISKIWPPLCFLALFIHITLTDVGMCYRDLSWPSKLNIANYTLSNQQYSSLSLNNCIVLNEPSDLKGWHGLLNLIFGRKIYGVECLSIRNENAADKSEEYGRLSFISIDACTTKIHDTSGVGVTKDFYESQLRRNRDFWDKNKE